MQGRLQEGTTVYDEIENSSIPTVLIPGLHQGTPSMDPLFREAYSHHASAEKVSICYNAHLKTGYEILLCQILVQTLSAFSLKMGLSKEQSMRA